jgi:hypothetical protein
MPSGIIFTQPTPPVTPPVFVGGDYGAFSDVNNQTISLPFEVKTAKITLTDFSNGVTLGADQLVFATTGVYNIQVSMQVTNSRPQAHEFYFWWAKNGIDITNSTSIVTIDSKHGGINGHALPTMNIFVSVNAGDNVELRWTADNINVKIEAVAPPVGAPIAPSVIITATQL